MVAPEVWGYLAVAASALAWGSFGVFTKTAAIREAKVDPMVIQCYMSVAIFLVSWLVAAIPGVGVSFTYWGVIGAAIWTPASCASIFGIKYLGLGVSQGSWSGIIMVTSFVWGVAYFSYPVEHIALTILALVLLLLGSSGLAITGAGILRRLGLPEYIPADDEKHSSCNNVSINKEEESLLGNNNNTSNTEPTPTTPTVTVFQRIIGVICVLIVGLFAGSVMVPFNLFQKTNSSVTHSIKYLISYGIGVLGVTPLLVIPYFVIKREMPNFHLNKPSIIIFGLLTGVTWSIGNFASYYATDYLGLSIGYPLTQMALLVAGLWGLFWYREIKGWFSITQFFSFAIIVLAGAALLGIFGPREPKVTPTPTPYPTPTLTSYPTPTPGVAYW